MKQVIYLMEHSSYNSLMKELAETFSGKLLTGEAFYSQLRNIPFFSKELSFIIQHGEMKGHLGEELTIYSELLARILFKN